jgi:hypothetical protein
VAALNVTIPPTLTTAEKKTARDNIVNSIFELKPAITHFKVTDKASIGLTSITQSEVVIVKKSETPFVLDTVVTNNTAVFSPLTSVGDKNVYLYNNSNISIEKVSNGYKMITPADSTGTVYSEGQEVVYNGLRFLFGSVTVTKLNNIVVNFNVTVDASSNLTIFGMSPPTEPADTIVAEYQLPVNALYDPSECLIEFWEEDNSENQIKCQLANVNTAASGGFDLSGAYQKTAKRLAHGLQKVLCNAFDCSKAAPYSENKYTSVEYYKQRDFGRVALGTFAHYLFGHVDATAAITNDIGFITGMLSLNGSNAAAAATNEGVTGPTERYGAWSKVSEVANNNVQSWSTVATDSDVNLAIRLVKTIVNKGLSGGEPVEQVVTDISTIDATNNTLAYIAAQVLGQDATRMMGHDNAERAKNIHQPLKFISGDVIYMNIKLPMPSVTISPNAAGSVSTNSLATKYVQERSYTLKITLGAADVTL